MINSYLRYSGEPAEAIQALMGSGVRIVDEVPIGGGCISHGRILRLNNNTSLFLKSHATTPASFFQAEADNLTLLKRYSPLTVPAPLIVGETLAHQYLCLEYIEAAAHQSDYWEQGGRGLATLHKESTKDATGFGLKWDNWIGSTAQPNTHSASWKDFYVHQRLKYQVALAEQNGYIEGALRADCQRLVAHAPALLHEPLPALVHGDLWLGNLMSDAQGAPALIDPAIYFADREVDIAMTMLFGTFDKRFYAAYQEYYPLPAGWHTRIQLYNLYHMLNHLNIFGGSYLNSVEHIVQSYLSDA